MKSESAPDMGTCAGKTGKDKLLFLLAPGLFAVLDINININQIHQTPATVEYMKALLEMANL